jgi:hypothetical protein
MSRAAKGGIVAEPAARVAAAVALAVLPACGGNGSQSNCGSAGGGSSSDASTDSTGGSGGIIVGGTFNNCPTVTSMSISPNELDVGGGGMATLSAMATVPGGAIPEYTWTAPSGIFTNPHAPSTTFECTVPGMIPITVTASVTACSDHLTGVVTCRSDAGD